MGTVTKALSLLSYFNLTRQEIGLSDMARLSGMNKATVYRMLAEMQTQGLIEQIGQDRAYRLGAGVLRLAALREAAVPLMAVSRDILRDLSRDTGETAHLSVMRGHELYTLSYAYSPAHATKVTMEDTEEMAFHATASGLVILAYGDPEFVATILSAPLTAYTRHTVTDPDKIMIWLAKIRETGIAESVSGFEEDVHSHAAPVFGPDRRPMGALGVAAPQSRMTAATAALIRRHLSTAAQTLTTQIGGFFPEQYPQEPTV